MQRAQTRLFTWIVVAAMLVTVLAVAAPAFGQDQSPAVIVYRFYNQGTGTHFYTASAEERDMVIATWPTIYTYEGPAFMVFEAGWFPPEEEPVRAPVQRFYNKLSKSHFYTTSAAEADMVRSMYPAVFAYDGVGFEAYSESSDYVPITPVYRFYNMKNGSHFYTISATEKAVVQIQMRDTYHYDGVAFYAIPYDWYYRF